jgi:hypothetical protein
MSAARGFGQAQSRGQRAGDLVGPDGLVVFLAASAQNSGTDHKWREPSQSRRGHGRLRRHGCARLKLAGRLIFVQWRVEWLVQWRDFVVPDVGRDFGCAAQPGVDRPFRFGALISEPLAELAGRKFAAAISAKRRQDRRLAHPGDLVDRLTFAAGKDVSHAIDYGPLAEGSATRAWQFSPTSFSEPGQTRGDWRRPGRTSRSRFDADDPVSDLSRAR